VVVLGESLPERIGAIPRHVDLAPEQPLGLGHTREDVALTDLADDHEVDIAVDAVCPCGNRTVDERPADPVPKGAESISEHTADAVVRPKSAPELLEPLGANRLIVPTVAVLARLNEAQRLELAKSQLSRAETHARLTRDLTLVERSIRIDQSAVVVIMGCE
jgi:hypothetical protein